MQHFATRCRIVEHVVFVKFANLNKARNSQGKYRGARRTVAVPPPSPPPPSSPPHLSDERSNNLTRT